MKSSKIILMVFEGERTEKIILQNLKKYFLKENTIVCALYGNVIYDIYEKLKEDEVYLDIVPILKEYAQNKEQLEDISREEISEIYLFFDHDGHSHIADTGKLTDMLLYFDNETENGKLYISYPMVEAMKHFSQQIDFKSLVAKIDQNSQYKQRVENEAENGFKQVNKYTKERWLKLIKEHVKKANYITTKQYEIIDKEVDQYNIFIKQKEGYIDERNEVAVLGSFPVFLFDYYGYKVVS